MTRVLVSKNHERYNHKNMHENPYNKSFKETPNCLKRLTSRSELENLKMMDGES